MNYQDLLIQASRLLRNHPHVRRYLRGRFSHLLVDEFQDTDPVQAQVIMYLTASDPTERIWHRCRPVPGSLFVVGDPKQSIYRFRRADMVTYNQVKQIMTDSGGAVVSLSTNFRTEGDIVAWTNKVFNAIFPTEADEYSPASATMHVGYSGKKGGTLAGVSVLKVPKEHSKTKEEVIEYESDWIARFIRHAVDTKLTISRPRAELERGVSPEVQPGDFMIVTRQKKHLAIYAHKLQSLDIAHQVTGGSAWGQVAELGLLADCLRALNEPENPVALVAVLRGEVFGMSDTNLYAYRQAGGKFSYYCTVPATLESEIANRFDDAFSRLMYYERLLKRLPLIPAIERIATDLGLPMRAMSDAGGDVQAATMAKAFEILRSTHGQMHCVSDVVEHLQELIDRDAEFDGIPARPYEHPVVRIMNLHKVKGLEAPIVFLADPTGKWDASMMMHVDRSGDVVRGYMAVHDGSGGHMLACPQDWGECKRREKRFMDAEACRLLYVAATRAGSQLIITQRSSNNHKSYWCDFASHLDGSPLLADPGPQIAPKRTEIEVLGKDIDDATEEVIARWQTVMKATYTIEAAKKVSMVTSIRHRPADSGEHGTEWGAAIHVLLETAMRYPQADLRQVAGTLVDDHTLDHAAVNKALDTVNSVMNSNILQRARAGTKTLLEVPFVICSDPSRTARHTPKILRGVIDLVFLEPSGWVIVDYKTDAISHRTIPDMVSRYRDQICHYRDAWCAITGKQVVEAGLYFTRAHAYVRV